MRETKEKWQSKIKYNSFFALTSHTTFTPLKWKCYH